MQRAWLPPPDHSSGPDLAAGVEAAAAAGLSVMPCNSGESKAREEHYLNLLQEQSYGVLITPVSGKTTRLDQIRRQGTPSVLVDRVAPAGAAPCRSTTSSAATWRSATS